jgi:hypothetical protein
MLTKIRCKLTEPSGASEIRDVSMQELDLISGGAKINFGNGISWGIEGKNVTLHYTNADGNPTNIHFVPV